jgi:ribose 5-phosphate isomerase A
MDDATRLATLAGRAAAEVQEGMTLGLGSGSTAEAAIRALGQRVASGLRVCGVPTSERTAELAREVGIPILSLDDVERLDLGIDGADEIDPALNLVKGRGGALLHEKLVALACADWLIVAAAEKLVPQLGTRMPLPVEVVPLGWRATAARVASLGLVPTLRVDPGSGEPFVTDGAHYLLDCRTGPIAEPERLAASLKALVGVVDHGLFVGLTRRAMVVEADGRVRVLERRSPQSLP